MLYLKPKQQAVIDAVNDPKVHTIVLIGAVGTGKTDIAAHASISIADSFPKTYWPVFRQNISTAKRSVIPSYLNMLELMNFRDGIDFRYNANDYTITFPNKSVIGFVESDITKDRQGRKIKGINATGNHIDEADELAQEMFITATSRRGRRNRSGQPSLSIITMNPNDTYLKELYYDPWKAGTLPEDTIVIEFTLADSWQSQADIDAMLRNPRPWVERYLRNNWSYKDDRDNLFKYRYFDAAIIKEIDESFVNALRSAGYDVAWKVGDRSVYALFYGKMLIDIVIVKDKEVEMRHSAQALEVIKLDTRNSVLAENTEVDAVGGGSGVVSTLADRGWFVSEFVSGGAAIDPKYADLRTECASEWAADLENGVAKIYAGCPYRNELISEAMAHNHETTSKVFKLESKKEIKKRLEGSMSPDIFDAVIMGYRRQIKQKSGFEILL